MIKYYCDICSQEISKNDYDRRKCCEDCDYNLCETNEEKSVIDFDDIDHLTIDLKNGFQWSQVTVRELFEVFKERLNHE